MKTLTTIAAVLLSSAAMAQDYSDRNGGLQQTAYCTNVPAASGSVNGVLVLPLGLYFVEAAHADLVRTDRIGGIIPSGLSSKNAQDMANYFPTVGLDVVLNINPNRDKRTITEEVETIIPGGVENIPVPRGTFDGNAQDWRITSMEGSNTIRVRTADDRPVDLRIAGNTVLTVSGTGEAYFDLPAGQSFGGLKIHDATTGAVLRNSTVSTNGTLWNGTVEVTTPDQIVVDQVDVMIRQTSAGTWCG